MLSQSSKCKSEANITLKNVFFVYEFFTPDRDFVVTDNISDVRKFLKPDNLVTVHLKVRMKSGSVIRSHTSRLPVKKLHLH